MKSQGWPPTTEENSHIEMLCFSTLTRRRGKKKRAKCKVWQEVRLHSLCSTGLFGARRDKPNQLKSVYRKWGQQTRSALQRRTPTPNFLGEESSTFKAMLLIRLHFRALVRNQNAQGIKCYLHTKLKRKNVAKCFLLSTKPPLRSH